MTNKFISLVALISMMGAPALVAQAPSTKPAEGSLMLDKKTYPLSQAVAFETTIDNEDAITVVLSRQAFRARN